MLPAYWIERPGLEIDAATAQAIDDVLCRVDAASGDDALDVSALLRGRRIAPWKVLCGLAERRPIAFHGTGDPGIERFEPRRPIDFAPFGDQEAVFATSDPIWAMFYAIVDRDRFRLSLNNGCIAVLDEEGRPGVPHYYFSVSRDALPQRPWRTGHLYLLPSDTFVEQPSAAYAGGRARVPQLASPVAVRPLARLRVAPRDFPFLAHVRGHDDERLAEYARAVMAAQPWPDE